MRGAAFAALVTLAAPAVAGDLRLGLPIDCALGETCHIQQYVDRDPGPGTLDHECGPLTYDGHKGTDFALPTLSDMEAGVNVLASAPGVVRGLRDGMADVLMNGQTADSVKGRECGNGVVLVHEGGWETQYCHLKKGSVRVKKGDRVERGEVLGQVGLSGKTQFPHVHLSVRKDGQVIDPFDLAAFPACGQKGGTLWPDPPAYTGGGLINAGFADRIPEFVDIKQGRAARASMPRNAGALVLFGYAYGGRAGDQIELIIDAPDGRMVERRTPVEKQQAQFFRATGKRLNGPGWPAGTYSGTVRMLRGGAEIDRKDVTLTIE